MIEVPTLNWIGKDKVVNHANDVPFHVLERKYSFDAQGKHEEDNGSQNKIIHGDNLLVLKSLLPEYEGKVKCIYIDPPYNTGNENWIYNDTVKSPQIQKWIHQVVGKEGEDLSRHDKWLCMMYPRLKLLRRLLADDGAIFISIDDNELYNLKFVCDEIFGANNFVGNITVVGNPRGRDYGGIARMHDYVLVYQKSQNLKLNLIEEEEKQFKMFDKYGGFELRELRNRNIRFNDENRPNLYYPFYVDVKSFDENGLSKISLNYQEGWKELYPAKSQGINTVWRWGKEKAAENLNINIMAKPMKNGSYMIVEKYRESRKMARSVWWDKDTNTEKGTLLVKEIFDSKVFDYPKPMEMIKRILEMGTKENSIVLDSFAGSGTTAHAVLKLNKEDGGNRKFILVEMEDYAERITAERVKRVIQGYGDVEGTDGDFNFYEIGEPLLIDDDLNESVPLERICAYIWYTETKTSYIEPSGASTAFLGTFKDTAYYFHYEKSERTILDFQFLQSITERAANYVIYADECALDDNFLTSHSITFKKIPRDISKL